MIFGNKKDKGQKEEQFDYIIEDENVTEDEHDDDLSDGAEFLREENEQELNTDKLKDTNHFDDDEKLSGIDLTSKIVSKNKNGTSIANKSSEEISKFFAEEDGGKKSENAKTCETGTSCAIIEKEPGVNNSKKNESVVNNEPVDDKSKLTSRIAKKVENINSSDNAKKLQPSKSGTLKLTDKKSIVEKKGGVAEEIKDDNDKNELINSDNNESLTAKDFVENKSSDLGFNANNQFEEEGSELQASGVSYDIGVTEQNDQEQIKSEKKNLDNSAEQDELSKEKEPISDSQEKHEEDSKASFKNDNIKEEKIKNIDRISDKPKVLKEASGSDAKNSNGLTEKSDKLEPKGCLIYEKKDDLKLKTSEEKSIKKEKKSFKDSPKDALNVNSSMEDFREPDNILNLKNKTGKIQESSDGEDGIKEDHNVISQEETRKDKEVQKDFVKDLKSDDDFDADDFLFHQSEDEELKEFNDVEHADEHENEDYHESEYSKNDVDDTELDDSFLKKGYDEAKVEENKKKIKDVSDNDFDLEPLIDNEEHVLEDEEEILKDIEGIDLDAVRKKQLEERKEEEVEREEKEAKEEFKEKDVDLISNDNEIDEEMKPEELEETDGEEEAVKSEEKKSKKKQKTTNRKEELKEDYENKAGEEFEIGDKEAVINDFADDSNSLISEEVKKMATNSIKKLESLNSKKEKLKNLGSLSMEELVHDILKQELGKWLDENLPGIVEEVVQKEIEKIMVENKK